MFVIPIISNVNLQHTVTFSHLTLDLMASHPFSFFLDVSQYLQLKCTGHELYLQLWKLHLELSTQNSFQYVKHVYIKLNIGVKEIKQEPCLRRWRKWSKQACIWNYYMTFTPMQTEELKWTVNWNFVCYSGNVVSALF